MAIVHKGSHQLQGKAWRNLAISIVLFIPLALYAFAFMVYRFHFDGFYHLVPMIVFGWPASHFFSKYNRLQAGVNGENDALDSISELPDTYHIFTNLSSEFEGKKAETDLLVIGPNGIFVIEVKNHNGTIEGDEQGEFWLQHKVGRKGGKYSKKLRNPIKQMKRNVYILSKYFQKKGVNYWIEGIVFFTNKKVDLCVESNSVYTTSNFVIDHIKNFKSKTVINEIAIQKMINILSNHLDDGATHDQTVQPKTTTKFCYYCGNTLPIENAYCFQCGKQQNN